jgi:hypothetical protein
MGAGGALPAARGLTGRFPRELASMSIGGFFFVSLHSLRSQVGAHNLLLGLLFASVQVGTIGT